MKYLLLIVTIGIALIGYGVATTGIKTDTSAPITQGPSEEVLRKLSRQALAGRPAFDNFCASCHGGAAEGTKQGPPLVHKTYNPGHHADEAFTRAVRNGVKQHHWRFGDMPARPEVSDGEIPKIVSYVRELQEASGIFYQPHSM
ncbi:MAG: cytochrome c [Proteobacteria bacterium]|nr:MAG: cytochrome c [Pseudomonadota bacterium]QKK10683.1 MAG: cytochrome c [Pseudomonadota bacterium]